MIQNERITEIGDALVEKRMQEAKYTKIDELKYFINVTLVELRKMHKDKKISFLFQSEKSLVNNFGSKKDILVEKLLTNAHGIFLFLMVIFIIFYSITYSQYIVLLGLPIMFFSMGLTSPYQKLKKVALILAIILLIVSFFVKLQPLFILMLIFSLTNIITNIVRQTNNDLKTKIILNNELALVKGYVNNIFTLRNNKNGKILQNVSPESIQNTLLWEFMGDLTV